MYKNILKIISTDRISGRSAHSAFTDLCEFNGRLICCYRQATNHVSGDGYLEIARFSADNRVVERQKIVEINYDLRDPKMSIGPDGKIWLTAFARKHASESGHRSTTMMSWFSSDGISWSSKHEFGPSHWWLWRVRWHNSQAFSLAYNRALDRLDLYSGHPGKQMFLQTPHALSKAKHNLGYPNESDLLFDEDGSLWALVRRDADTFTAQLGFAKAPYRRWQWKDLGEYIGGPVMHRLSSEHALVAGRVWTGKQVYTQVWLLHLPSAKLLPLIRLPSGGDNSYPGMVIKGDVLYLSYYSAHIDGQPRVYLATLTGINTLLNIIK